MNTPTPCNVDATAHDTTAACQCGRTCPHCHGARHDDIATGPHSSRWFYCFDCGQEFVATAETPDNRPTTRPYSQWDEYREQRQDNADAAANDAAIGPAIYIGAPPYPANELDSNPEPWTPYYVACCACGHVECRPGPPSLTWPTKCETCGRTDQIDGPHDDPADAYDICDRYPEEHGTHPYHDHGPRYEGD